MRDAQSSKETAAQLVELAKEIEDLETSRAALLKRLELARERVQRAGRRTAAARASVALLRDHVTRRIATAAELRAIQEEIEELGVSVIRMNAESLGLLFEAESLQESLGEAEDEMERLLTTLVEGKGKQTRGH